VVEVRDGVSVESEGCPFTGIALRVAPFGDQLSAWKASAPEVTNESGIVEFGRIPVSATCILTCEVMDPERATSEEILPGDGLAGQERVEADDPPHGMVSSAFGTRPRLFSAAARMAFGLAGLAMLLWIVLTIKDLAPRIDPRTSQVEAPSPSAVKPGQRFATSLAVTKAELKKGGAEPTAEWAVIEGTKFQHTGDFEDARRAFEYALDLDVLDYWKTKNVLFGLGAVQNTLAGDDDEVLLKDSVDTYRRLEQMARSRTSTDYDTLAMASHYRGYSHFKLGKLYLVRFRYSGDQSSRRLAQEQADYAFPCYTNALAAAATQRHAYSKVRYNQYLLAEELLIPLLEDDIPMADAVAEKVKMIREEAQSDLSKARMTLEERCERLSQQIESQSESDGQKLNRMKRARSRFALALIELQGKGSRRKAREYLLGALDDDPTLYAFIQDESAIRKELPALYSELVEKTRGIPPPSEEDLEIAGRLGYYD